MDWVGFLTSKRNLNFLAFLAGVGIALGILIHFVSASQAAHIIAWLLVGWGALLVILVILSKGIQSSVMTEDEDESYAKAMKARNLQMEMIRRYSNEIIPNQGGGLYPPVQTPPLPRSSLYIINEQPGAGGETLTVPSSAEAVVHHRGPSSERKKDSPESVEVAVPETPPTYESLF